MEPTVPFQPNHSEYGFTKNTAVHFGGAQFAINEDDRHFLYLEAAFVGGEFHFYLEGVSFEADAVQIDAYDTGKKGYYNMTSFKNSLAFHLAIGYPF